MKIHLLLATLLVALASTAQIHDLANMAEGNMIFSDIVYDNDGNVFGYMYLFQRNIEKGKRTVEYVFLELNSTCKCN